MMDLIENIGPLLGLAAFAILVVFVLALFQQARELRRLREWAGRGPERAIAEAERSAEALEAKRESDAYTGRSQRRQSDDERPSSGLRLDPLLVGATLATLLLIVGIFTQGFGVLGDGDGGGGPERSGKRGGKGAGRPAKDKPIVVAVFNGTQTEATPAVPGIADAAAREVTAQGFKAGAITNSDAGFDTSLVMYEADRSDDAGEVASALEALLGPTATQEMTQEIAAKAEGAPVALVVGADDSGISVGP